MIGQVWCAHISTYPKILKKRTVPIKRLFPKCSDLSEHEKHKTDCIGHGLETHVVPENDDICRKIDWVWIAQWHIESSTNVYTIGFREDGIVVWKKIK